MIPQLHGVELVTLLFIAVIGFSALARRLVLPYPILLVIGGLFLALIPGLPPVRLDPEIVFFLFLPPILVRRVFHLVPRLPREPASDRAARDRPGPGNHGGGGRHCPRPGAGPELGRRRRPGGHRLSAGRGRAVAILRRLGLPRRLLVILEGESLVNDAMALVLYRSAVGVMVTGAFSLGDAVSQFIIAGIGGVAIGLAVGALAGLALRRSRDSLTEIAITLLAPYIAWSLGERTHASAVLACVAGGLLVRRSFSSTLTPATRLQARAVWDLLIFALNGVIFILIGLQLRTLAASVPPNEVRALIWQGLLVSLAAIVTRLVWVPIATWLPRRIPSVRARDPMPPWRAVAVIAWAAMRGIVTLAAALALPLTTADGRPLPFREHIILLAFVVILVTLVIQGLSLGPVVRALRIPEDGTQEREEVHARHRAVKAALDRLERIEPQAGPAAEPLAALRQQYEARARKIEERQAGQPPSSSLEEAAFKRARHETLNAERHVLIELRDQGEISDDVLLELERELDLEAIRHGLADFRPS